MIVVMNGSYCDDCQGRCLLWQIAAIVMTLALDDCCANSCCRLVTVIVIAVSLTNVLLMVIVDGHHYCNLHEPDASW